MHLSGIAVDRIVVSKGHINPFENIISWIAAAAPCDTIETDNWQLPFAKANADIYAKRPHCRKEVLVFPLPFRANLMGNFIHDTGRGNGLLLSAKLHFACEIWFVHSNNTKKADENHHHHKWIILAIWRAHRFQCNNQWCGCHLASTIRRISWDFSSTKSRSSSKNEIKVN